MRLDLQIADQATPVILAARNGNVRFARAMVRGINRAAQELVGIAVKEGFTGKGPFPAAQRRLGVVTGRLRKSIRATLATLSNDGLIDISFGSNVNYFAVHEFGFKGTEHVRGHVRKFTGHRAYARGKLTKASSARFKSVLASRHFDGKGKLYTNVKPHGRKVDIPARAPLGTVLRSVRANNLFNARIGSEIAAAFSAEITAARANARLNDQINTAFTALITTQLSADT